MTELMQSSDEGAALEALHSAGMTDGLPVVVPTPDQIGRASCRERV